MAMLRLGSVKVTLQLAYRNKDEEANCSRDGSLETCAAEGGERYPACS